MAMIGQNKSRLLPGVVRSFSCTPWIMASHYDVLGISPKATQNDIKSAYYNLSKLHHPDKSKDEASAKKFRAVKEAYEVLGNVKLKKMYDKGLLVGKENTSRMEYRPDPNPTDPTLKFYKSHSQRHIIPTMDGKTPIYNFDDWSRNHYGDLFQQSQKDKIHVKKKQQKQMDAQQSLHHETVLIVIVILTALFFVLVGKGESNYDVDTRQLKEEIESNSTK